MPQQFAQAALGVANRRMPQRGASVMGKMGQWVSPDHPDAMHDPMQAQGSWGQMGQMAQGAMGAGQALAPQVMGQKFQMQPGSDQPPPSPQGTLGDLYSKLQAGPPAARFGDFAGAGGPPQFDPNMGGDIRANAGGGNLADFANAGGGDMYRPQPEMAMGQEQPEMAQLQEQPPPMAFGRARGGFMPQRGRLGDLMQQRGRF